MSRDMWSPHQYRVYSSERGRPVRELLARIGADEPRFVVDLGCGPGECTLDLAARWPGAFIDGIDSSDQMIVEARRLLAGDAADPGPARPVPGDSPEGADAPGPDAGG